MDGNEKQRIGTPDADRDTERDVTTTGASPPDERRVVASVHGEASPAKEQDDVRVIGNTDVPVTARDPDAP